MTIFIKTYVADLPWLEYCLASILKYAPTVPVVIVADYPCRRTMAKWNLSGLNVSIHYVRPTYHGYLYQQEVKMRVFDYVSSEYVIFIDSDCMLTGPLDQNALIRDGKPTILMTPYEDIPEVMFWKQATDEASGLDVEFEFMRRNGLVYRTESIRAMWNEWSSRFMPQLRNAKDRRFSEFNLMGAWCYYHEREKYNFINTRDEIPPHPIRQFWSYGSITPEIRQEMNTILGI